MAFTIPVKNQIAAFRMVNPRGTRIGVVFHPENSGHQVEEASKAAGLLRIALVPRPVASVSEIPQAVRTLLSGDTVDALWIPADPMLLTDETRRYILTESLKAGKPVYAFSASLVSEGALVSNGPDLASIGQQAGELVNRLAAGDKARIDAAGPARGARDQQPHRGQAQDRRARGRPQGREQGDLMATSMPADRPRPRGGPIGAGQAPPARGRGGAPGGARSPRPSSSS